MKNSRYFLLFIAFVALVALACQAILGPAQTPTAPPTPSPSPTRALLPTDAPTPLPPSSASTGLSPDEPVLITGDIPYTSPFFLNTISEPFVLLEDQAGFFQRNLEFEFSLASQAIGAVELHEDQSLTYALSLPVMPQGTFLDVDNDGETDTGVQVFAIAYWSNTWGDPFLEARDGTGWSTAYASTTTDPERENEINGGTLVVWAPDGEQSFPTGFGPDGKLFTQDDPTEPIPSGYSLVDLDREPFRIYKEAQPQITLNEGEIAVNDYSQMSFSEAFDSLFEKVSREYPFTVEKNIDWQLLYDEFAPRTMQANDATDFYRAMRDFTYAIPDAHVGITFDPEVFFEEQGGSFGMLLAELSDGRVIVTEVLPEMPAAQAGIEPGAEILSWDGTPVGEAIDAVTPFLGPFSTPHHERLQQVIFLTRFPPGTELSVTYRNPGATSDRTIELEAVVDYDSLFAALPGFDFDPLALPVEGEVLDESGLGYLKVTTFSDDYRLIASLWDRYINDLIDNEVPGVIIDVRVNSGGSGDLARDFAGYFFEEDFVLSRQSYYSDLSEAFEYEDFPSRVEPAPSQFTGPVALLVSPYCISACEGFAYAMAQNDRAIIIGHYPTAGAFGEVGRGQYDLPGDLSAQFPTGRPETPDGELLIEGQGVEPDILVPVTEDSALGRQDTILQAAIEAVLAEGQ